MESPRKRQKTSAEAIVIDLLDSPLPPTRPVSTRVNTFPPSSSLPGDPSSSTEKENQQTTIRPFQEEENYFNAPWQPSARPAMPPAGKQLSTTVPPHQSLTAAPDALHQRNVFPGSVPDVLHQRNVSGSVPDVLHQRNVSGSVPDVLHQRNVSGSVPDVLHQRSVSGSVPDVLHQRSVSGGVSDVLNQRIVSGSVFGQVDVVERNDTCDVRRGLLRAAGVQPVAQSIQQPFVKADEDEDWPMAFHLTQQRSLIRCPSVDMTNGPTHRVSGGLLPDPKSEMEGGQGLSKKDAAALAKLQKAAVREEEKKKKAAEKEQQRLEKELQKQQLKEAKERKALEQQQEKASKKAAKDLERQAKGKNCLNEIVVLIDRNAATASLFWAIMGKLGEERSATSPPFKYEIQDLTLAPLHCIAFKRVLPMAVTQSDTLPDSQGGNLPYTSQCSMGAASQGDVIEVAVPYVLLVFDDPNQFIDEVLKDQLRGVIDKAVTHHPDATLGILTVDLDKAMIDRERKDLRPVPGGGLFNRQTVEDECMRLALSCPAVRFRHVQSEAEAAEYVRDLTRALAEQPYRLRASFLDSYHNTNNNSTRDMELRVEHLPPNSAKLARALHGAKGLNLTPNACAIVGQQYGSLSKIMGMFMQPGERSMEEVMDELANAKLGGTNKKLGVPAAKKLITFLTSEDPDKLIDV